MDKLPTPHGYNISDAVVYSKDGHQLKQRDLIALLCPLCELVLRDPVQVITCGHRFCKDCLDLKISASISPLKCPVDGEVFEPNQIRNDKGCCKEIKDLLVDCPTKPLPCSWKGSLTKIEDHYKSCEGYPASCDFCKKNLSSRKQLEQHLEDECTEYNMNCPDDKCTFVGKRPQMVRHIQEKHTIHCIEEITKLCTIFKDQKQMIGKFEDRLRAIERLVSSGVEMPDMVEADGAAPTTRGASKKLATLQPLTQLGSTRFGGGNGKDPVRSGLLVPFRGDSDDERDSGRPREVNAAISKLCEDVTTNRSQVVRVAENMQSLQETVTHYSIAIDEIRLRQDVLDVKTTNGMFTWKIPDVRRRYGDAVERRTISLYSPPFYTSPHGYRMCIRVYLNGDGLGRGTHVSVFFVLMRSEHDNLLSWPFRQSVRFTLVNQVNPDASISEAFVPDLQSPSFQKPDSEMNIASGYPKFAKQTVLNDSNFTLGDVIFIKAQVDLMGLNSP